MTHTYALVVGSDGTFAVKGIETYGEGSSPCVRTIVSGKVLQDVLREAAYATGREFAIPLQVVDF